MASQTSTEGRETQMVAVTDMSPDVADEHRERRPNDGVDDQPDQQLLLRRRAAGYEPVSQRMTIGMTPHQLVESDS